MRSVLALKIMSYLTAIAVIGAVLAWVVAWSQQSRMLESQERRSAEAVAETTLSMISLSMRSGDKALAKDMLGELLRAQQVRRLTVYSPDGSVWVDARESGITSRPARSQVRMVAEHGASVYGLQRQGDRGPYTALVPIRSEPACLECHEPGANLGVLSIVISTADLRSTNEADNRVLIGATILVCLTAILAMGLALTVHVAKPIKRLAAVARAIAEGDTARRAEENGRDEIALLGRAFNDMTDALHDHIAELASIRSELQSTIERLAESISCATRIDDLVQVLARESAKIGKAEACSVMLTSDDGTLVLTGVQRIPADAVDAYNRHPLTTSDPIVIQRGLREPAPAQDPETSLRDLKRFAVLPDALGHAAIPITHLGNVLGFISLADRHALHLDDDSERILRALGAQAGVAIAHLQTHEQVKVLAVTDPLTGLSNRRHLAERLETEVGLARRHGHFLAFVLLDVDHFKAYNDRHGHTAGDEVLRWLGALLRAETRVTDVAARYGGEEFAMLLVQTDHDEAMAYAERLRGAVQDGFARSHPLRSGDLTVSIGVAVYPYHAENASSLVDAADRALYEAKTMGRNRVVGREAC